MARAVGLVRRCPRRASTRAARARRCPIARTGRVSEGGRHLPVHDAAARHRARRRQRHARQGGALGGLGPLLDRRARERDARPRARGRERRRQRSPARQRSDYGVERPDRRPADGRRRARTLRWRSARRHAASALDAARERDVRARVRRAATSRLAPGRLAQARLRRAPRLLRSRSSCRACRSPT